MLRNERITRSLAFSLALTCGLAVAGCGDAVGARLQGGVAPEAVRVEASAPSLQQHLIVSSDGRDPYSSARDLGTGEFVRDIGTGELVISFSAARATLGPEQHLVVSSDARDPYRSARDPGTGEFIKDIATGESLR